MAHAVNKKLFRTKRANKAPTARERVLTFVEQLAEMADDHSGLTDIEKRELQLQRDQLCSSVAALIDIIDAHDALQMERVNTPIRYDKPFDTGGNDLLCVALSAAFLIGSRATRNPITHRIVQEKLKAKMSPVTRAKILKSKTIYNLIMNEIAPILKRQSNRQSGRVAADIFVPLNEKIKNSSVLRRRDGTPAKPLKLDTIRRIINVLRNSVRSSG